ncbi:MAG: ABC transporter permease, partial [Emcibacter sp.]|nr:ABC transporter permease [Emcibacter sp.]
MSRAFLNSALKFALRESRSALRHFKIFIASLFLGTAIIAGVGSVTANISDSIRQDGKIFLGGDMQISQIQKPFTKEERGVFAQWGTISEVATLRTMAQVENDGSLVDLKAVDGAYPLYGSLTLREGTYGPDSLSEKGGRWGIILSDALATRLNLNVGGQLRLGTKEYEVRGIIKKEPDVNSQGFQLAPGATIALKSLFENSLVQPGSLIRFYTRIKLNQNVTPIFIKNNIKEEYPDRGWGIRDSNSGGTGLRRFVSRMGQFMT